MTRAEKEAKARELRARGLLFREIAAEMGVAVSTVDAWLNDPGGKRLQARKDSYRGTCRFCGAATTGCNGRDEAPDACLSCVSRFAHELRRWTPETVIEAIQTWADEHGGIPPRATEWLRALDGRFPPHSIVQREFGSWAAGIRAAGFEPWIENELLDHDPANGCANCRGSIPEWEGRGRKRKFCCDDCCSAFYRRKYREEGKWRRAA